MTDAQKPEETKRPHRLEKELEIAASVEEVWSALTDGRKLSNWFPLEARVKPGANGSIFVSWGPDCEGEAEIVAWEPGKKIAWQERTALVEFTLEARGGKTLVRLVQSGFFTGADWENEWFDSTNYGWEFMLLSLRVWLELHRAEERRVAWPRLPMSVSREEAYRRLLGKGGLFREDAAAILLPGKKVYAHHRRRGRDFRRGRTRESPARRLLARKRMEQRALVGNDRGSRRQIRRAGLDLHLWPAAKSGGRFAPGMGCPFEKCSGVTKERSYA